VRDVLQSLEFQVHLNLRFCCGGKKQNIDASKNATAHAAE
jgi:hypothetical protein